MSSRSLARPCLTLVFAAACARGPSAPQTHAPAPATAQRVTVAADGPRGDAADTPTQTPPRSAEHSDSGLAWVVLAPGSGSEHPGPGARIRAHYVGWTASDLAMFDNSYDRGEPVEFQAEHVIRGWGELVGTMVVGERRRVWIPEALAYQGKPGLPAGTLIFDVELVAFEPAPPLP
ncbi:MAG: FKBP-type peptidyl-prolyl cis-trans isomerase [Nannocystaceae bacterium]|nr:FKBP-type peptidyl-prolyl cis-trans isomerase [Nannocystaceae bacterium]